MHDKSLLNYNIGHGLSLRFVRHVPYRSDAMPIDAGAHEFLRLRAYASGAAAEAESARGRYTKTHLAPTFVRGVRLKATQQHKSAHKPDSRGN